MYYFDLCTINSIYNLCCTTSIPRQYCYIPRHSLYQASFLFPSYIIKRFKRFINYLSYLLALYIVRYNTFISQWSKEDNVKKISVFKLLVFVFPWQEYFDKLLLLLDIINTFYIYCPYMNCMGMKWLSYI